MLGVRSLIQQGCARYQKMFGNGACHTCALERSRDSVRVVYRCDERAWQGLGTVLAYLMKSMSVYLILEIFMGLFTRSPSGDRARRLAFGRWTGFNVGGMVATGADSVN